MNSGWVHVMKKLWLTMIVFGGTYGAASADMGRCLLQVDKRTYLDGTCNVEMQDDGSFSIGMGDSNRSKYFAVVDVDPDTETARGFWNGRRAESRAHDELGELSKQGGCWVNSRARICARLNEQSMLPERQYRERERQGSERERHGQERLGKNSLSDLNCKQVVTLYAMTSKAQIECDYEYYSDEWRNTARSCQDELGERGVEAGLKSGLKMFDDEVRRVGKSAACKNVIEAFPDAVQR